MHTGIGERYFALPGLLIAAILLSACGDMPTRPADDLGATAATGYGRAFGRIDYLEDGKGTAWSSSVFGVDFLTLFVRSARTGEMQYMQIEGDGDFYWPLKPDEYVIIGYQVTHKSVPTTRRTGRLMSTFSVSQAGQAVYVGDLRIRAGGGRYGVTIADQYEEALKRIEARLAAGRFEPARALMRFEERTGSYKRMTGICSGAWGIVCSKEYQGVEPLLPSGTAHSFPVTENLTPLLEWKPTSRPDVTYDVAIYEALTLEFGGFGKVERMRGSLVAYAEGLREPRYSPTAALQPGKRYEWTVRLRHGDAVSSWSATSYFMFAVVAWARGSGQGFGFATPSK